MEEKKNELEILSETLETAITGIPAPLRKNFLKAFSQLCTAVVDIPISWLEGKADLIRSVNNARKEIIKRSGENITEQINIPDKFIKKAISKYASKIINEQINLDEITNIAAKNLNQNKNPQETNEEITDDWLNEFENIAKLKSSDDMKLIFGKILSGEISNPGKFSIRTLKLISQLDNEAAKLFQIFCSNVIVMYIGNKTIRDAKVVSFSGAAGSNSLSKYGLSFDNLNILQEYGLIISDYNSYYPYDLAVINKENIVYATIEIQSNRYFLVPDDRENFKGDIKFYGVTLSKAGKELLEIIPKIESKNYFDDFVKFVKTKNLTLHKADKN